MELHQQHVELLGHSVHHASHAASLVRPVIGDAACRQARRTHRRAARVRHDWSDAFHSSDVMCASIRSDGSLDEANLCPPSCPPRMLAPATPAAMPTVPSSSTAPSLWSRRSLPRRYTLSATR
eukprot:UN3065